MDRYLKGGARKEDAQDAPMEGGAPAKGKFVPWVEK